MSREIKFRVKGNTGDKLWTYFSISGDITNIFNGGSIWHEGHDWETLCQYTGLKDKNGAEIWEGDILKTPMVPTYVLWSEKVNGWVLRRIGKHSYAMDEYSFIYGTGFDSQELVEVIGNIYENPELPI